MLIIGAGGFAKEIFEILYRNGVADIAFYDDVNKTGHSKVFDRYPLLQDEAAAAAYFKEYGNEFVLGLGNPLLREKLCHKFQGLGGSAATCISEHARIGSFGVQIGEGCNILDQAIISNSVTIGKGCILYYNVVVTHDCTIGDFVEISPSANILGHCTIGAYARIGANATILPGVKIGTGVTVGAGAVVTRDLADGITVAGVPAKPLKP